MHLTLRRALCSATVSVVVLTLGGCGGDDTSTAKSSPTPAKPPATSATASSSGSTPGSASQEATPTGSTVAATGEPVTGEEFAGVLKDALSKATTARISMDLGSGGSARGEADYAKNPPEIAMTMKVTGLGDMEVRMLGGTMYMKSPTLGATWVSLPLDDPNGPLGSMGDLLDMTKTLESFADAVTSATHDTQEVDGESLEHYTAQVDTQKFLQSMPDLGSATASVPKTVTQEWWFDEDGLIRRFSGDFGASSMAMTFTDWGDDVSITAPPADQVTEMPGTGH